MENQNPSNMNVGVAAACGDAPKGRRKRTNAVQRTSAGKSAKVARKSKKERLIGLLSKPSGARVSVLAERLQWQAHTVRAALSGLRKQGFEIATSKPAKTGETVYAITGHPAAEYEDNGGAAA